MTNFFLEYLNIICQIHWIYSCFYTDQILYYLVKDLYFFRPTKKLYMRHLGLKSIFYLFTFITIKSKIFHITLYNLSCLVFIYILIHYKKILIDQFYLAVTAPWNNSRKMAYNRCAYISITKRARKLYLVSFCSPEKTESGMSHFQDSIYYSFLFKSN